MTYKFLRVTLFHLLNSVALRPGLALLLCALGVGLGCQLTQVEAQVSNPRPVGLVGYWKINEGAGATIYDYSGGLSHGEVVGKADWEPTESGPALRFDGKTGYVEIPDGAWNTGAPMTLICWSKSEGRSGHLLNLMMGGAISGSYALAADGLFSGYDGAGKSQRVNSAALPGTWSMSAVTLGKELVDTYFNGELKKTAPIAGWGRVAGNLSVGARGVVPDNYFAGNVREVAVFNRVLDAKEISAIYESYLDGKTLYEPAPGLKILAVAPELVLYKPTDVASVDITVKNFSSKPQTAVLAVGTVGRLASSGEIQRQPLSIPARESRVVSVKVPLAGQSFGCAIQGQLLGTEGAFDTAQEFVGVADNAWLVGVGGTLDPSSLGRNSEAKLQGMVKKARRNYANWLEMYFWAPDDWGNLNPTAPEWYSGQASYFFEQQKLRNFIGMAHKEGMKMVTYGKHNACGPDGVEITRKQPQWFRPFWIDVRQMDQWNDKAARAVKGARFDWQPIFIDFRQVAALDYGLKQIVDSAANFGWDGVRYDGHYTVSSDAVSAWNIRRLKEAVWAKRPDFLLGFNYAFAPSSYANITREMKEAMAGYGMWMQEAIGSWGYGTGAGMRYTNWTAGSVTRPPFATHELAASKQVYGMGGQYHSILRLNGSASSLYKLVYSLIAGAHPVYGTYELVPGSPNWGRFMTRWSAFIWHPRLQASPASVARVTVDNSQLYWKPLVQELVDTPTRKFTVVHLVNPSPEDAIAKTTIPDPVQNVMVRLSPTPGSKIQRAFLVRPEQEPFHEPLALTTRGNQVEVRVPQVAVWAMLVVEESGTFAAAAPTRRFAEVVSDAELKAGREQAAEASGADPLQPPAVGLKLQANEQFWETDSGYNSVTAQEASDADAMNGLAQIREAGVAAASAGRTWLGSFVPGKHQVRLRLKFKDSQVPAQRQTVSVRGVSVFYGAQKEVFSVNLDSDPGTPEERRLKVDGKYHYYTMPVMDFREQPMLHVFIGFGSKNPAENSAYSDHVIVQELERYTDTQLAQWFTAEKPAGLRVPNGTAPEKILQVRGTYWSNYGLEQHVPGVTGAYSVPEKYEELYAWDAIVLTNVPLPAKFAVRRMLRDFVEDGGRLVLMGGTQALGQGGFPGTLLEETLPYQFPLNRQGNEVVPCEPALQLGSAPGKAWAKTPLLMWRHQVTLRPGASALAYAGDWPVAARMAVGKGQVNVFAGTVMGEAPAGQTPFWDTTEWATLAQKLVRN